MTAAVPNLSGTELLEKSEKLIKLKNNSGKLNAIVIN